MSKVTLNQPDCKILEYNIDDVPDRVKERYSGIYSKFLVFDHSQKASYQVHHFPEDNSTQPLVTCPYLGFLVAVTLGDRENASYLFNSTNMKRYKQHER